MSVSDFLFGGKAPESVTKYGSTATDVPAWYSDYTQAIIGKANAIAAEGYQAYDKPRIAQFNALQKQVFNEVPTAAKSYTKNLNKGIAYTKEAAQGSALDDAQGYIKKAAKTTPGVIENYLNPYTTNVVDRIGDLANRQLSENIIPTIQNQFIAGGTFGGSRSGEALGKATRDLQESTMAQQSQALERGYTQAGQQATADQNRLAQLGQLTGALSAQDLTRTLSAGEQLSRQSALEQSLGLNALGAMESVGDRQQRLSQQGLDLAYEDFLNQRDYDRDQISFLNAAARGMTLPTRAYTETTGPADTYVPGALSQAAQTGATIYGFKKSFP